MDALGKQFATLRAGRSASDNVPQQVPARPERSQSSIPVGTNAVTLHLPPPDHQLPAPLAPLSPATVGTAGTASSPQKSVETLMTKAREDRLLVLGRRDQERKDYVANLQGRKQSGGIASLFRSKVEQQVSVDSLVDQFNRSASEAVAASLNSGAQTAISEALRLVRQLRTQPEREPELRPLLTAAMDRAGLDRAECRLARQDRLHMLDFQLTSARFHELGGPTLSDSSFSDAGSRPDVRSTRPMSVSASRRSDPQKLIQTHLDPTTGEESTQVYTIGNRAACQHRFEFTNSNGGQVDYLWSLPVYVERDPRPSTVDGEPG